MPNSFSTNPLKTRQDVQKALISLLDPLAAFTSPGGARIKLGHSATHYDDTAAQLEGFARPLWGLASLLAGEGTYDGVERWLKGFENGTDPESEEFWGWSRGKDQRMVEMSPIGYLLATCPEQFWAKLSPKAQKNLSAWLYSINDKEMPDTNWLWFRVFANLGLSKIGSPFSKAQLHADLDHLDTFYLGDGWSRDGPPGVRQLDYYSSSFAIQVAQLIYSKLAEKDDPIRCEEYRDRARKFAVGFAYYFDAEGRAIPFGRSMAYRFAMAAFWGALAFADVLPPAPLNDWGIVKGLLLRNIRYWTTQPILDASGVLTIGFNYPSLFATENYNSPGSPYWAFKAFIPLSLPPSHPFWTSEELPHPLHNSRANDLPLVKALDHPGHILSHLSPSHTFLLSSGQACHYPLRHGAEKYGKLAYSSAFGYAVPTGAYLLDQHAPDSTIALSDDGGEKWAVRREVEFARLEHENESAGGSQSWLRALWKPWADTEVETFLIPPQIETPDWHLRVHRIRTSRAPPEIRTNSHLLSKTAAIIVSDAGFSIYSQGRDGRALENVGSSGIEVLFSEKEEAEGKYQDERSALVRSSVGLSGVYDLTSEAQSDSSANISPRAGSNVPLDANANIVFPRSILPTLISMINDPQSASDTRFTANVEDIWLVTGVFAVEFCPQSPSSAHSDLAARWAKKPVVPLAIAKYFS